MTEIEAGLEVTVIGMGTVFILLSLLVWIINAMSRLSRWIEGPAPPAPHKPGSAAGAEEDERLASVIGAAVAAFRGRRRG